MSEWPRLIASGTVQMSMILTGNGEPYGLLFNNCHYHHPGSWHRQHHLSLASAMRGGEEDVLPTVLMASTMKSGLGRMDPSGFSK